VPGIAALQAQIDAAGPLERLSSASQLAEQLRARGEELLDHFVAEARSGGASWSDIGCALGTSKQAAQQRFAALADPAPGAAPFGLKGPAADVLEAAADEARQLGHHYVRPEHIVLGLLAYPQELAGGALAGLGVTPAAARRRVEQRLGSGDPRPAGSLGVAPQTKRLLELARAIAKSLRHNCPRGEHILLAATSPKLHSSAAELLADLGASPDQVRQELARTLMHEAPELAAALRNRSLLSRVRMRGM
jgi:uncharacterized protein YjiS (DUF1127 family)